MNRRMFNTALPALLLAACGDTEMEYELQSSPIRTAHGVNTLVPSFGRGEWTPTTNGTATYGGNTFGRYARIGPLVFIEGCLEISTIGTGNTTFILGMPFSALPFGTIDIGVAANVATNIVSVVGRISVSQIDLWSRTAASADPALNPILGDTTILFFSGWYFTTD